MQATDKLTRALTEVKYLNADNVSRYRCIMRIFFENYEKLKYWLYQEDVYEEMIQDPYFSDYRMEQCQQDLAMLTEWKNLNTIQDTRKVSSIEEFKNKKFRYQMSEYSVQIERLVLRLENLSVEGASLEPSLLERIRHSLEKFSQMKEEEAANVYSWWNDLNNDFMRLNQNYQDYIRDLNSVKAEKMMQTKEFLVFKDRLIEYLRNFIKGLQRNVGAIEECLRAIGEQDKREVYNQIIEYEWQIPRMDMEVTREMIEENVKGRGRSIYEWFVAENGRENEAGKLFDATNEIIRKITRYAAQISEKNAIGANRREEYRKVAELFLRCETVGEAHKMSARVFGMACPFHLKGTKVRESDSMNQSVYEEKPEKILLRPRVRNYREKTKRSAIRSMTEEKRKAKEALIAQHRKDWEKIKKLEKDGKIDFSELPVIEPRIREILLKWLSDGLEDAEHISRTEEGRKYVIEQIKPNEKCVLRCEDGNLTMPRFIIVFQEEDE
ncbi:MAG: TIGR02677 family protein [Clostridiales bacterium]|nr:TIGR02677 family protein [Eubacterium sp.]MDD7350357.1 TIGR02677 family protein [Clostridiales bacterium]MDY3773810.1 TIGR02677 family protein [Eubacterium sp.]